MDAPGFYAAFPWGGYAQSKGATGTRSNLALLYSPLSPPYLPTPGRLFGHGGDIDRAVHRGPPPERSGEGGSSLHGSKTSCALPHRSRGQVSVGFHGIKSKKKSTKISKSSQ